MPQFVSLDPNVEINGESVQSIIKSFPEFMQAAAAALLEDRGIVNVQPGNWYSQKDVLNTFKDISEKYGPNTLFQIGKAIPSNSKFPPQINDLHSALDSLNVAYGMNHRGGAIGFYKLVHHDRDRKEMVMQCKNPYPGDFDRGIITALARKYERLVKVELDASRPSRENGGEESWYLVNY